MKKLFSIILTVCMILSVCALPVHAEDTIKITVDGKVVDCAAYGQEPAAINGTTLVPLRSVFEALGATVAWDGETKTVVSTRGNDTIALQLDSDNMFVNGEVKVLSVPAQSMNERTMVPVRAIAEAFGCDVKWDGDTRTVVVTTIVNSEETPEDVVKIVYTSMINFDLETPRKYFIDEETAEFYLGEMSLEQVLDSIPGINLESKMKETMLSFMTDLAGLTTFEIGDTVSDGDYAWVDVILTTPDMDKIQTENMEMTEEESMEMTLKALEKCGLTILDVEKIEEDPVLQEEFMYAVIEISFDYVMERCKEGIKEGKVLTETLSVELQKINGRWLIVE